MPETSPSPTTATRRVGWGFIASFFGAYIGFWLAVLLPGTILLAVKVTGLVGPETAATVVGPILGAGALLAMIASPVFGQISDRTTGRFGMRRPWMIVGALGSFGAYALMAVAPNIPLLALGTCLAALFGTAAGAAMVGALPDQVPEEQRGLVSGILGVSLPIALVGGTFLVQLFATAPIAMFLVPSALSATLILIFTAVLRDRRLAAADRTRLTFRELARTFYLNPRRYPDFGWVWVSRFLMVLAYAFLTAYQAFFLLNKLGSAEADVPNQVFQAILVLSVTTLIASVVAGKLSDAFRRRKIFVVIAASIYALALILAAFANDLTAFLIAMAVAGVGFGAFAAVDLALVTDVLPDPRNSAKDLGVFNIASTLPQSLAPALAPLILAVTAGSYSALFLVGAVAALLGGLAVLFVKKVR